MKVKKFLVGLAVALVLLVAVMTLTGSAAIPGPEFPDVTVFLSPMEGPPANAIQLVPDPGFELGHVPGSWHLVMDAEFDVHFPHEGLMSLWEGGNDGLGGAEQVFFLSDCQEGPVWVDVWYSIMTPLPNPNLGRDRTDGWIMDEYGNNVAHLWTRWDSDHTDGYMYSLYRVDGLFDACAPKCQLNIYSMNDNDPWSVTDWNYDDVHVWCLRKSCESGNCVYMPSVMR